MQFTEEKIAARLQQVQGSASTDGYTETNVHSDSFRCAAVLMPLLWNDGEWHLLFTRRTERVESHKGQVSFPGGACHDGEKIPEQTALRETQEEIGIQPRDVRVLGRLTSMATISHFLVTPIVGVIPWPYVFRPEQAEVARIFNHTLEVAGRKVQPLGAQSAWPQPQRRFLPSL
jgi:8-oxo-dGTP pyrophosphatase MutT (NUDIX family)